MDKGSSRYPIKRRTHRRNVNVFRYYWPAQWSELSIKDLIKKYDKLNSELLISKNSNSLLLKRIANLERNALNTAQYFRRETIEINLIPTLMVLEM